MNTKSWVASLVLVAAISSAVGCEVGASCGPGPVGTRNPPGLEEIRDFIVQRCELSSSKPRSSAPWYFYYESGVELLNDGDAEHALEPLRMTAYLRPEPARATRMYGMWFVDYLPYYQLSRAFSELGEWSMAWKALAVSEQLREFTPQDEDFPEFEALKARIAEKIGS